MFKPQPNKVKSVFYEARRNMKKIILTEIKINKKQNNEANANKNENDSNIFKLLQNFWINNLWFIILKNSKFVYFLLVFLVTFTVYTNVLITVVFMVRKRKKPESNYQWAVTIGHRSNTKQLIFDHSITFETELLN